MEVPVWVLKRQVQSRDHVKTSSETDSTEFEIYILDLSQANIGTGKIQ